MTNAPPTRKTHVTRIVGRNRAGERLTDIWLDIERMDIIRGVMQIPPDLQWQGFQRKLRWGDNPDEGDYFPEGLPSRLTTVIKVCDPDQDVDDPDEWIPVRVIRGMRSIGGGSELQGQGFMDRFRVDPDDTQSSRVVQPRKIVHYDTNIDDLAQAAFDADPERTEYVVPGDQYEKDLDTKDEDQFVEHEIITFYKPKTNNLKISGLGRQVKLLNQYLLDESELPDNEVIGASGFNPPYRLDPFQNIVNVQLGSAKSPMVGFTFPHGHVVSDDGDTWSSVFTAQATNAASGFGRTVVMTGNDFVAFGKPRDGEKCFITANSSGVIQRGTILNGSLEWASAGSLPFSPMSCHFAGEAFFIGYNDADDRAVFAVSFDGESFTLGVHPFPGVDAAANGTLEDGRPATPRAGSIAYDRTRGLYVTVGNFQRHYAEMVDFGGGPVFTRNNDVNLMSSVSGDGLSWTPRFDTSEVGVSSGNGGVGKGGGPNFATGYCVAFGNGRFVACGHRKSGALITGGPPTIFDAHGTGRAAALVSQDGATWSCFDLPGQPEPSETSLSASGAVIFVPKRGLGTGIDGYFVMTSEVSTEVIDHVEFNNCMIHYSLDGASWSQVASTALPAFVATLVNKSRGEIVNR